MSIRAVPPVIVIARPDYERLSNLVDSARSTPLVGNYLADELERLRVGLLESIENRVEVGSLECRSEGPEGALRNGSLCCPVEGSWCSLSNFRVEHVETTLV